MKHKKLNELTTINIKDFHHPNERYNFIKKMGDGSASKIYITMSKHDGKKSVTKKIHKSEEWKSELAVLRKVSKYKTDKLIKLLDFFETPRNVYIVTKLYDGYDLFDHIDINVPIREHLAIQIIREMAKCVKHSHLLGIAHLDIKCENFLVVSMSPPKFILIDFGHAENVEENVIKQGYSKYGTRYYLCPEGYDMYYSTKSDIWSLGVCAHLILTGEYPYSVHSKQPNRDVKTGNIKLSRKLSGGARGFLLGCLDRDPVSRLDIDGLLCSDYLNNIVV